MRARIALVLAAAASASIVGCSAGHDRRASDVPLARAERAESAGRLEEAAAEYARAAGKAESERDRHAWLFRAARAHRRAGNRQKARAIFERIVREGGATSIAAESDYWIGRLAIESNDSARGYAHLRKMVERHPDSGVARRALERVTRRDASAGRQDEARTWLEGVAKRARGKFVEQAALYERAKLLERRSKSEALRAHLALAEQFPYPFGIYRDDSLYRASEIEEELGHPDRAIAHLEHLLADRETASFMGSYQRPKYAAAQMRIGELYRDRLRDPDRAARAFAKLADDMPTSILADDARYHEALVRKRSGEDDDACRALRSLAKEHPRSRYVACAPLICPSFELAKPARACRPYLVRTIRGALREPLGR